MHVTLFANIADKRNPYITLLQRAVQPYCEGPVTIQPRFSPGWVLSHGKAGSIVHIHWLESHLTPCSWFGPDSRGYRYLIHRLENTRVSSLVRTTGLLAQLALALMLARRVGMRVVYTVHNLDRHRNHGVHDASLKQLGNRLIFARADAVHVHSHHTAKAIAQLYGRAQNVFVVPHGNYVGWYPNVISRTEARLRLNLPSDAFVYLFLGQIAPYKGLEDLVEAFVALGDPSTWLVVAGRVSRAYDSAYVAAVAQRSRVLYRPGFVPDEEVQVYLNAADVMVLPYRQITTSGSALLAFSFGQPVVAPALGALSEIVPASVGVSYIPTEAGALTAALRRARHISWSSQAILAHARRFDWQIIGTQMADIYRTVLRSAEAAVSSQER